MISLTNIKNRIEYTYRRLPKQNIYELLNKESNIVGRMVAYPEFINDNRIYNPNKKNYYSLYIKHLFIDEKYRNKGAGQALLDVAITESFNRKCHGNVHLIAQNIRGNKPPQQFYRKFGFDSQNKYHIDLIDKSIEAGKELPLNYWVTPMYLT